MDVDIGCGWGKRWGEGGDGHEEQNIQIKFEWECAKVLMRGPGFFPVFTRSRRNKNRN